MPLNRLIDRASHADHSSEARWNTPQLLAAALSTLALLASASRIAAEAPLVLNAEQESAANFYGQLKRQAFTALDARRKTLERVSTLEQIEDYQQRLQQQMREQLGGFPARTPLNAQVVGVIQQDGYRIEKVIYDSLPHHHITANLYLPEGDGPFPGVVVSSGHSRTAKTADYNQRFGIAMAVHGMAAICFDPIGQGERSQIVRDGKNLHSGTTTEHFLIGVGSTLVGRNTATYRIWDAMRSIDYLQSRKEIDGDKIGMTGCSGGGTLTSYVMALDHRVRCAAPACYLTTFRQLLDTIGPQDAEQNIFAELKLGIDQPDYVLMRAPRPTLIASTTGDFFPIEGSWETFRQAKQFYGLLGRPECVDLVETGGKHGVTPQNLATIAHWMRRWLVGKDAPTASKVYETLPGEQLLCTDSGQVMNLPGEKSVIQLNQELADQLAEARAVKFSELKTAAAKRRHVAASVRAILKAGSTHSPLPWQQIAELAKSYRPVGKAEMHEGVLVEKWLAGDEKQPILPTLVLSPQQEPTRTVLFLHDLGKAAALDAEGQTLDWVSQGARVIAVDLPGQGETGRGADPQSMLGDWKTSSLCYLLGDSLSGVRARATLTALRFAAAQADGGRVEVVAVGKSGIAAKLASAIAEIDHDLSVQDAPESWSAVVADPNPVGHVDSVIHGALRHFDLSDLPAAR